MKFLLIGLLAVFAASADVSSANANGGANIVKVKNTALVSKLSSLAVSPVNGLDHAKDAINALKELADIFNSDMFEGTQVKEIAEVVSKVFTFVNTIIGLIQGSQESDEMKFLREQFTQLHAKLDSISLQIDEVKRLIDWRTTRVMYANCETFILAATTTLNNYLSAPESNREVLKRQFLAGFEHNPLAPLTLYQAIVEKDFVIAQNLGAAVIHYTQNHRRHVTNFLLAMQRLIMRGAQLQIAYENIKHGDAAGTVAQRLWDERMQKLLSRMQQLDSEVKGRYHSQMSSDLDRVILDNRHLSNKDFSSHLYGFLADKFDRRYWIALSYKDVSGSDKHYLSHCGGGVRFRTHGNRNVVVASADPKTSQFTQARANAALDAAEREVSGSNAESWTNRIRSKIGSGCSNAALVGSVCWGCDVWFTMRGDRYVYRKISRGGTINAIVFG